MKALHTFQHTNIKTLFTDIDGTLTDKKGRLSCESFEALWKLHQAHVNVIPVTGRPAGWCDMMARLWPIHGVIGENGAIAYRYLPQSKTMLRYEAISLAQRAQHTQTFLAIQHEIQNKIPGAKVASDQFCRLYDLAIDFAEDVPALSQADREQIKLIFETHGARAKISNIHVNGWLGDYDKLSTCQWYCENWLGYTFGPQDSYASLNSCHDQCAFIGDSPNDESMFHFFKWSVGVSNVCDFLGQITHPPKFICDFPESQGFVQFANHLLGLINNKKV